MKTLNRHARLSAAIGKLTPGKLIAGALLGLAACSTTALAAYPEKPINLIVPFPAGSGTDAVGRIFAEELSKLLGQPVIVENKPGANATIAANYVAKAKPDGYTLFVTTNTSHSAAPWLMKNVAYDPIKDFTPIARGGNLPFLLVANPTRPYKTVQELVSYAKSNPDMVTYASGNSTGIVAGATFGVQAGLKLLHVPYKGTPQALTDLVGGQVDFMFTDFTSGMPFVKSGRLHAMAVSTAKRSELVPDLPSMEEAGMPDFDINSWNGYFGPAGMPPDVVKVLNTAINKIVSTPETKNRLAQLGFDAFSGTPDEFAKFVKDQYALWGKWIKAAGIEQR